MQHILIAVPCGFEGGGRLRRFPAAGGQLVQSVRQRFGPGAAGVKADITLGCAETLEAEGVVAQQVAGGAVGIVFQCVGGVTADDAPQDGVGILCGQRVLASDLRGEAVGRGGVGLAVGRADAGGVQQADGADLVPQGTKALLAAA